MKLKRSLWGLCALLIVLGVALSQQSQPTKENVEKEKIKTIAITQIVDHPSLNQARQGILDTLAKAGYQDPTSLKVIFENPHGSLSVAHQIAVKLQHLHPDVLVAISTPSAQTLLASNPGNIPIVFSSVSDPLSAQLISDLKHSGGVITGVMEEAPWKELLSLLPTILHDLKRIGVIYNPSEVNSARNLIQMKENTALPIQEVAVQNSLEVGAAIEFLAGKVDAIVLPADNTVFSALGTVVQGAQKHHLPIFSTDPESVHHGVALALGYSQYEIGCAAGEKILLILQGEKVGEIPVTHPPKLTLSIHRDVAKETGLKISKEILSQADEIFSEGGSDE